MDLIFGRRFRDNALQGAKNSWKKELEMVLSADICIHLQVYLEDKRIVYDETDTSGTTMKKIR